MTGTGKLDSGLQTDRLWLQLQEEAIDISRVQEWCADPKAGAINLFVGTTRNNFQGKAVRTLYYEAYQSMALKELEKAAICASKNWPGILKIAIIHRLNEVPVKEASIAIAVSTPHRKESFEACEFLINEVKAKAPIFKKEIYEDTNAEWKANHKCC
eukprot:Clim_evm40s77 gene=Clim_evmTU40s77